MNKNNTLKVAGGVLGASAIAAATTCCVTSILAKAALDRKQPKVSQNVGAKFCGYMTDGRITKMQEEAEEKLFRSNIDEVRIKSHDGLELVGHWYPADHPKRVIVAMHGWRSSWSHDFGIISEFFHDNGCSVLFAEQRGQNNSGGDYMGFGATEQFECLAWTTWVNRRLKEELPIYLCGVSMGATTVLMASALPLPANVHGILADCGFTSPDEIWEHVARDNLHIAYSMRRPIARKIYKEKNQLDAFQYSTEEALSHARVPVLFVHGTNDHFVPVEMTYRNYQACTAPKQLLIVPGAEHGISYLVDTVQYQQTLLDFWNRWDSRKDTYEQ